MVATNTTSLATISASIASVLAVITGIVNLIISIRKSKQLKAQIDNVTAVINTTDDLRKSVLRSLEGIWELRGDFDKFRQVNAHHYSKGYLILQWNVRMENYDALYIYSVFEDYGEQPIVTVVAKGFSNGDISLNQSGTFKISFSIDTRAAKESLANIAKTFDLSFAAEYRNESNYVHRLISSYETDGTIGQLVFQR